jgi:putative nucleotidyltransferase with HDIG domain
MTEVWFWRALITVAIVFLLYRSQRALPQLLALSQRDVRERAIEALAVAVNCKDKITAEHVRRVRIYAAALGRRLGCSDSELQALREAALLHDVGKIGVPDAILMKPDRLTPDEFEVMKTHTLVGYQLVSRLAFPYPLAELIRAHHERWDGTGYPFGLKGHDIPVTARILSVVDCFDALQHERPYKRAYTRAEAVETLLAGRATQFDPAILDLFLRDLDAIEREAGEPERCAQTLSYLRGERMPESARSCAPAAGYLERRFS